MKTNAKFLYRQPVYFAGMCFHLLFSESQNNHETGFLKDLQKLIVTRPMIR